MKRVSLPSRLSLEDFYKRIRDQVSSRIEKQVEAVWDATADQIASEIEWDAMEWIDHSFQV